MRKRERPTRCLQGSAARNLRADAGAHSPAGHQMDRGGWNGTDDRRTGRPKESGIDRKGSARNGENFKTLESVQASCEVSSFVGIDGGRTGGAVGRSEQCGPVQGVFGRSGEASS